jgi:hypothetical protein
MRGYGILALLALTATGSAANAQAERQPSFVRLSPGGLAAGQPGLHSYAAFSFGMPRAQAIRRVGDLSGGVSATGISRACGAHPLAFARFDTLTLYFRNQRFVGWSLAGPRARRPVESEWQLGIGSTRGDVAEGDDVTFRQTAGGTIFSMDGTPGRHTGRGARARVSAMWAGETCRGR